MAEHGDQLLRAIDFAESRLRQPLSLDDVARAAGMSRYHFHRSFRAATGETVGAYLRRRRLTEAARALLESDRPILQLALDFRFESQQAFTRAFKQRFGVTPGRARRNGGLGQPLTRPLTAAALEHRRNAMELEPDIVEHPGMQLVGLARIVREDEPIPKPSIRELWELFRSRRDAITGALGEASYGLCMPSHPQLGTPSEGSFVYMAAVEVASESELPDGMVRQVVPPGRFAVFKHTGGLSTLGHTVDYVWGTWLPKSGRARSDCPDFERYDGRMREGGSGELEIYVPVV